MEAVLIKRQPGDSPGTTKQQTIPLVVLGVPAEFAENFGQLS